MAAVKSTILTQKPNKQTNFIVFYTDSALRGICMRHARVMFQIRAITVFMNIRPKNYSAV